MNKNLKRIEETVLVALRVAAASYRKEQGRFLPVAEKAIHLALTEHDRASALCPQKQKYAGSGRRRHQYDIDAIRKGCMMGPSNICK
jgi:hypothetical protein